MARPVPTLEFEHELFATGARIVAGMDEVGRGAIAGPVTVGVVAIDASVGVATQITSPQPPKQAF